MSNGIQYILEVIDKATEPFKKVWSSVDITTNKFKVFYQKIKKDADTMKYSINTLYQGLDDLKKERGTTTSVKRIRELNKEISRVGKAIEHYENLPPPGFMARMNKLGSGLPKIGGLLAAAFSAQAIKNFGQEAVTAAGDFGKLQKVMSVQNLGNTGQTASELKMLGDFANQYGLKLEDVEGSYLKLKSQNFSATAGEMRQLSDLASSTGKSFDQLAEAILDGQTGEFERLKEFGIKARQSGNDVAFSFKGIETVVSKNEASIRKYLLSLGDLNGVHGSSAAIAEEYIGVVNRESNTTLDLKRSIGSALLPVMTEIKKSTIAFMNALKPVGEWMKEHPQFIKWLAVTLAIATGAILTATIAMWLFNSAILANPITWIVAGILALIAAIAYVIVQYEGWGNSWMALMEYLKYSWMAFKENFSRTWMDVEDLFIRGIEKLKIAWYNFQSLWDEDAANAALTQIGIDQSIRQKEMATSFGKEQEYKKMADEAIAKFGLKEVGGAKKDKGGAVGAVSDIIKGKTINTPSADVKNAGKAGKEKASGVNEGGNRPTNITIHINKLQDSLVVNTNGGAKEGGKQAGMDVVNELLTVLTSVDKSGGLAYE